MTVRRVQGIIHTRHRSADCVAKAVIPDNLERMVTRAEGEHVRTEMQSEGIRTMIASVDDYLMNLSIAEELCSLGSD